MSFSKKERAIILDKSKGFCWYCGKKLTSKGWHVDHVKPIIRGDNNRSYPERDDFNNLVPSCAPCNLFKGVFSLEEFRREIGLQVNRARRFSVNFRTAERFGLIESNDKPIVFWFEYNERD